MFAGDMLQDRMILVTGGGSGLGLSMSRRFLELGASVAICGRSRERLDEGAAELRKNMEDDDRVFAAQADVRDFAQVETLLAGVVERFGRIDCLVNNAAGNFLAATEDLSPNGFDAVVRTVLHGTFHATLAAGRHMIEAGGGSVLNVAATYAWTGSAFVVPSAAAKAGVVAMTQSLAVEWAEYDVRVNAIAPGPFPTQGAWQRLMPTEELQEAAKRRVPANRFGEHRELTNLAAFLLSDASPYITGECVTIDGGRWLASGGEFNHLTRRSRSEVKTAFRKMRDG